MHSQHSDSRSRKRKRHHARSQWPDPDPGWPDLDSLLSGPDVPLGWTEQDLELLLRPPDVPLSWSHSDLESLLRLPDDLLKALDAPLGWSDPAEWQWPDPGWRCYRLYSYALLPPCITGGPPVTPSVR